MLEVPEGVEVSNEGASVARNTICIKIDRGRFGIKRQAGTDDVEVASDKSLLALSKVILQSPELSAVQRFDADVSRYLQALCLKSMFRGGVYLIPIGLVAEVNDYLTLAKTKREELVAKAVETYDQRVVETSERLRVLSDASDYPSKERFAQKFHFDWQFLTWETPTQLRQIRASLFEVEAQKAAAKLSAVADECRDAMRAGMADLVDHLVDKLTPDPDGKRKIFSKSIIENFNEFFRTFEMRNVTDDAELAGIVAQARQVLNGVDTDSVRKDAALREAMVANFSLLRDRLLPMTVDRSTREIVIPDDIDSD